MRAMSTSEVCRMTGATPRQLQWWDMKEIVIAERNSTASPMRGNRSYQPIQVRQVQVLMRMSEVKFFRNGANSSVHPSRIRMTLSALRCRYVVFGSCGELVGASDDPAEIIRHASVCGPGGFAVVDLGASMPDSDTKTPGQA